MRLKGSISERKEKKVSKKKVTKKDETKKALARKKLVTELVTRFDLVENAEKNFSEKNSENFRKASIAIYEALESKVFGGVRKLADEMNRSKSVVHRYAQAGKFLKGVSDEQLKEKGFNAYDVKNLVRKISKEFKNVKSAGQLQEASTKAKTRGKKTNCTHTIDGLITILKDHVKVQKDIAKLQTIRTELNAIIAIINSKNIETPKGKALTKVLVK